MAETPTVIVAENGSPQQVLVNVFLRGGADGLHLVPPVGDDGYQKARPTLALSERNTLPLEGIFRLNRNLAPLYPLWEDQQLAIIHQAGNLALAFRSGGLPAICRQERWRLAGTVSSSNEKIHVRPAHRREHRRTDLRQPARHRRRCHEVAGGIRPA